MTEFREVKSTPDDLRIELKDKRSVEFDRDRTHTNSEVGGGENQLKDMWAVDFDKDKSHTKWGEVKSISRTSGL